MPATAIERHSGVRYFSVADTQTRVHELANGNSQLSGVRVFRSGTFRDSLGVQHTWEPEHLQQMVFNFQMLRDRGIFPNVPVRTDHSWSVNDLVGYFADLRVEGNHLVADLEITEPEALERWSRGTYRARSLEVGMYETNDESVFWPVVMGVAFVDIPAVEGLYSRGTPRVDAPHVFATHTEERALMGTDQSGTEDTEETVQVEEPEVRSAPNTREAESLPLEEEPARTEGGEAQTDQIHAKATATFRVNGRQVADFGAVQSHIDALEQFQSETRDENRRAFVRNLVAEHKIAATQGESLTAHALSLDESQWAAFSAVYSDAPALRLYGEFGNGVSNPDGQPSEAVDETAVLEETVAMHQRSGMSDEQVKQTASYRKLEALRATTR